MAVDYIVIHVGLQLLHLSGMMRPFRVHRGRRHTRRGGHVILPVHVLPHNYTTCSIHYCIVVPR